jgi:DNA-directed RNA polymerase subunit M/transcription elongation factor TFIIS
MNGGSVYNNLKYKLNNNLIKIIQKYILLKNIKCDQYHLRNIKYGSLIKCKKCGGISQKHQLMRCGENEPIRYMYSCYNCWYSWRE